MAQPVPSLLLASSSPRRRELLAHLGLRFQIFSPDVDESPAPDDRDPARLAERLARAKAAAGRRAFPLATVIAADTVVFRGGVFFGKPRDAAEAAQSLRSLAGATHEVHTGLCVASPAVELGRAVVTRVRLRVMSEAEIAWYVSTGEPSDKAGAYAIQGQGSIFVEAIEGSWSNVVGLPMAELTAMLSEAGVPLPWLA